MRRYAGDVAISDSAIAYLIQEHFPVQPVPALPRIRLHRAGPKSGIWRLAERDEKGFGTPYWAYAWGGGLVLAQYISDHPERITGQRVLDLGTGSGLVAIAAAKAGASEVMAADVNRYAMVAASLNATINKVKISTVLGDLLESTPPTVDMILIGDLFYEPELASRVTAFLDRCSDLPIEILIGDPWRAHLPHARLRLIAEYPVMDFGAGAQSAPQTAAVFAFRPSDA